MIIRPAFIFILLLIMTASWMPMAMADVELQSVTVDLNDTEALQRGARVFMNYCSGCHALRYMRYNRMAKDLGLTTFTGEIDNDLLLNNLIFTSAKVHDPIINSMPATDARQWFGKVPPDLSLSAREHGPSWIYTYLKSFYVDKKRPFGANNALVPDVAMPNILAPLAGKVIVDPLSISPDHRMPLRLILVKQGKMDEQEFDSMLQDLVTFLTYVAEPVQLIRYRIGIFVILFLCVFLIVAYQLKRFYWRNVH